MKPTFEVRLRQDSGSKYPEYTKDQLVAALVNNSVLIIEINGTVFFQDKTRNNKIMAVIDKE